MDHFAGNHRDQGTSVVGGVLSIHWFERHGARIRDRTKHEQNGVPQGLCGELVFRIIRKREAMGEEPDNRSALQLIFTLLLAAPIFSGELNLSSLNLILSIHDVVIGVIIGLSILLGIVSFSLCIIFWLRGYEMARNFLRAFWLFYVIDVAAASGWMFILWSGVNQSFDIVLKSVVSIVTVPLFLYLPFYQRKLAREILGPEAGLGMNTVPLLDDYRKMALSKLVSVFCAAFFLFGIRDIVSESIRRYALGIKPSDDPFANLSTFMLIFTIYCIFTICINSSLAVVFYQRDRKVIGFFNRWFVLFSIFEFPALGATVGLAAVPLILLSPGRNANLFFLMICIVLGYFGFYLHINIQRRLMKRIMEKQSEITA